MDAPADSQTVPAQVPQKTSLSKKVGKSRRIRLNLVKFDNTVKAAKERTLTEKEHRILRDAQEILNALANPPRNNEKASAILGTDEKKPKERAKRKGGGRKARSDFPHANVIPLKHEQLQAGDLCSCGCGRLYPLKRPLYTRHVTGQASLVMTIYESEQLRCNACEAVYTPALPGEVQQGTYDASAKSTIAFAKYGLGSPFHRQAIQYAAMGVPIAASMLWEAVDSAIPQITPAYDYLWQAAAEGEVGYFDDTSMPILKFVRKEDDDRTGLFTTGIVSTKGAIQVAIFVTGRDHAGENRAALLKKRPPNLPGMIQMSDALAANTAYISSEELIALCLAHARRNFVKALDNFPDECRHVIEAIGSIYHHDSICRDEGHTPQQRLVFHQKMSGPVMNTLKVWLDEQMTGKRAEPNSELGKAIAYMRRHWTGLTLFLREAGAPLDSNAVERILKKVVLHRKNSYFYKTTKGAKTGDIYMSLIATCHLNKVSPYEYLTAIQRNSQALKASPEDWMPWTFKATLQRMRGPTEAT